MQILLIISIFTPIFYNQWKYLVKYSIIYIYSSRVVVRVKKFIRNYKFIFVSSLLMLYILTLFLVQFSTKNLTQNTNNTNNKESIVAIENNTYSTKLAELRVENYSIGTFASNTLLQLIKMKVE